MKIKKLDLKKADTILCNNTFVSDGYFVVKRENVVDLQLPKAAMEPFYKGEAFRLRYGAIDHDFDFAEIERLLEKTKANPTLCVPVPAVFDTGSEQLRALVAQNPEERTGQPTMIVEKYFALFKDCEFLVNDNNNPIGVRLADEIIAAIMPYRAEAVVIEVRERLTMVAPAQEEEQVEVAARNSKKRA